MTELVRLVENNSLRVTDTGYELKLRLLWYRSLPISCIETVHLVFDGQTVDPKLIRFGINNKQFKLDELPDLVEEFWFIQDSASLIVLQPGRILSGTPHSVTLDLGLRFPYIPIGPGKFLTRLNRYSDIMVAA